MSIKYSAIAAPAYGAKYCITAELAAGADTTNETNEDADPITTSDTFPKGITIYGMWDKVELNSGSCIVYVAPRSDYRDRA